MFGKRITVNRFILTFSVLIAFVICGTAVVTKSLWGDEAQSVKFAKIEIMEFNKELANDFHPPVYFLLLKVWMIFFSDSEISLRSFQFIQILFLFFLTAKLFKIIFPEKRAPIFLFAFFLSSELWLFSYMVRYYALSGILAVFSTIIFIKWIKTNKTKHFVFLIIAYIISLYTFYPLITIPIAHLVYIISYEKIRLKSWILSFLIAIISLIPWTYYAIIQINALLNEAQTADLNETSSSILIKIFFTFYSFSFGETSLPWDIVIIAGVIILIVVFSVSVVLKEFKYLGKEKILVIIILFVSVIMTIMIVSLLSKRTSFIYLPARCFFSLPFFFLMLEIIVNGFKKQTLKHISFIVFVAVNFYGIINIVSNKYFINPIYLSPWKAIISDLRGFEGYIWTDESIVYNYYSVCEKKKLPISVSHDFIKLKIDKDELKEFYILYSERESTKGEIDYEFIKRIEDKFILIEEKKYLKLEENYRKFKSWLLKRESYAYKYHLRKYVLWGG